MKAPVRTVSLGALAMVAAIAAATGGCRPTEASTEPAPVVAAEAVAPPMSSTGPVTSAAPASRPRPVSSALVVPSRVAKGKAGKQAAERVEACLGDPDCGPEERGRRLDEAEKRGGHVCEFFRYGIGTPVDLERARRCYEGLVPYQKLHTLRGFVEVYDLSLMRAAGQGGPVDLDGASALIGQDGSEDVSSQEVKASIERLRVTAPSPDERPMCEREELTMQAMNGCGELEVLRAELAQAQFVRTMRARGPAMGKLAVQAFRAFETYQGAASDKAADDYSDGSGGPRARSATREGLAKERVKRLATFDAYRPTLTADEIEARTRLLAKQEERARENDQNARNRAARERSRATYLAWRQAEVALYEAAAAPADRAAVARDVGALLDAERAPILTVEAP